MRWGVDTITWLPTTPLLNPQRIRGGQYSVPAGLQLSPNCLDLLRRIFVGNPAHRLTLDGVRRHPWFLTNLPLECQARRRGCVGLHARVGEAAVHCTVMLPYRAGPSLGCCRVTGSCYAARRRGNRMRTSWRSCMRHKFLQGAQHKRRCASPRCIFLCRLHLLLPAARWSAGEEGCKGCCQR